MSRRVVLSAHVTRCDDVAYSIIERRACVYECNKTYLRHYKDNSSCIIDICERARARVARKVDGEFFTRYVTSFSSRFEKYETNNVTRKQRNDVVLSAARRVNSQTSIPARGSRV